MSNCIHKLMYYNINSTGSNRHGHVLRLLCQVNRYYTQCLIVKYFETIRLLSWVVFCMPSENLRLLNVSRLYNIYQNPAPETVCILVLHNAQYTCINVIQSLLYYMYYCIIVTYVLQKKTVKNGKKRVIFRILCKLRVCNS